MFQLYGTESIPTEDIAIGSRTTLTQVLRDAVVGDKVGACNIGGSVKDALLGRVSIAAQANDQSAILSGVGSDLVEGLAKNLNEFRRCRLIRISGVFDEQLGAGNEETVDAFLAEPELHGRDQLVLKREERRRSSVKLMNFRSRVAYFFHTFSFQTRITWTAFSFRLKSGKLAPCAA